jgi:hypothetical protein
LDGWTDAGGHAWYLAVINDLIFRRRQEVLESESASWKAGLVLAVMLGCYKRSYFQECWSAAGGHSW